MRDIKVYFHQYWFTAVLHYKQVPTPLVILQEICNGISFLLNPIPLHGNMDLGFLFWEKICLPLNLYIDKKIKGVYIRLPWEFAKKNFPEDYKDNKRGGFVFEEYFDERKELSRKVEREWEASQDSMSPSKMSRTLKMGEERRD